MGILRSLDTSIPPPAEFVPYIGQGANLSQFAWHKDPRNEPPTDEQLALAIGLAVVLHREARHGDFGEVWSAQRTRQGVARFVSMTGYPSRELGSQQELDELSIAVIDGQPSVTVHATTVGFNQYYDDSSIGGTGLRPRAWLTKRFSLVGEASASEQPRITFSSEREECKSSGSGSARGSIDLGILDLFSNGGLRREPGNNPGQPRNLTTDSLETLSRQMGYVASGYRGRRVLRPSVLAVTKLFG